MNRLEARLAESTQENAKPQEPKQDEPQAPDVQAKKQEQRKGRVEKLISDGILQKVTAEGLTFQMWTRSPFYAFDYDAKTVVCEIVYTYCMASDDLWGPTLDLRDSYTGKSIGTYSPLGGLKVR